MEVEPIQQNNQSEDLTEEDIPRSSLEEALKSRNYARLSDISHNLGYITAGNITLPITGWIKGGQTGYNTGTGFFLGYDVDAYKLSIGNPSTYHINFDGTNIDIQSRYSNLRTFEAIVDVNGHGDYADIQSALDAGKKRIFVRGGTYTITSTIQISSSDILIQGEGSNNTILKLDNGANCDIIKVLPNGNPLNNITIKDIQIDGNKANNTSGNGIVFAGGSGIEISRSIISGCYIHDTYLDGLNLSYFIKGNIGENIITNCNNGIYIYQSQKSILSLNQLDSNSRGIYLSNSSDNVISNNQTSYAGSDGIYITASTNNLVLGNESFSSSQNGIYIASSSIKNVIIGNRLDANNTGVSVDSSDNNVIEGNQANDNSYGIHIQSSSYPIIIGNQANNNSSDGIFLYYTNYGVVANNQITGNTAYGMAIDTNSNNNIVVGNYMTGNGSSGVSYFDGVGTGTIIKNNYGYNPVGMSGISVGASPFTYTAGASPETVYITGGTVSDISKNSTTLFSDTGHSVDLEPHGSVVVTYTDVPTMNTDIH